MYREGRVGKTAGIMCFFEFLIMQQSRKVLKFVGSSMFLTKNKTGTCKVGAISKAQKSAIFKKNC